MDDQARPSQTSAAPPEERVRQLEAELAVLRDELHAARERQRQGDETFGRFSDSGMMGIALFNTSGRFLFANGAFRRLIGYSVEELDAGRVAWDQIIPPEGRSDHERMLAELQSSGAHAPTEREYVRQDGARFWGLSTCVRMSSDTSVCFLLDVTERRNLESDARRLAAIVESSGDAIVSKDLSGVVTSWNKAAERIFGYTAEEIIGRPIALLVPPERPDEEPGILERIRMGEQIESHETVRVRKDGQRLDVSVTISPVKDAEGRIVGASTIARDITIERALREESQKRFEALAEAGRRKDDFLAMLAHELRNPLGAISNAVHVLERPHASEAQRLHAVQVLRRQVQHQARIVNELLDVSRINRGLIELHPEAFDLVRLVRDTAEDYRMALEQERIALHVDAPEHPVRVSADPTRLAQVVGNLLGNALKFTTAGGRVNVTLDCATDSPHARITVSDTGIGIEPELLPHVFDSFSQGDRTLARSRGGLGLGLAIVKGLIDRHGGQVEIESAGSGHGTTVRVLLPTLAATEADPLVPAGPMSTRRVMRVLVVEDHQDAAEMLRDLLELDGYEVRLAYTGLEGVRLAREYHPDVILCDLGLPGMDGYEVAAALRTAPGGARQRLVAVTGYTRDEDRRRTREVGFQAHLVKPVDPDELREVLLTLVDDMAR